jgi:hypothetical protein
MTYMQRPSRVSRNKFDLHLFTSTYLAKAKFIALIMNGGNNLVLRFGVYKKINKPGTCNLNLAYVVYNDFAKPFIFYKRMKQKLESLLLDVIETLKTDGIIERGCDSRFYN